MHPDNCATSKKEVDFTKEMLEVSMFVVECSTGDEGRNPTKEDEYWTKLVEVYSQTQAETFIKNELQKYGTILYYRWVKVNRIIKYFGVE